MKRVAAWGSLLALFFAPVSARAEPEVRESAVEEVMPGIFVRDPGSGVTIDLGDRRCSPPCGEGQSCESVCEETACDPREGPRARCNACRWECE
jgi:hypothetical protein